MSAVFGTAPEGEKIASAAINANGKIYTGPLMGRRSFEPKRGRVCRSAI